MMIHGNAAGLTGPWRDGRDGPRMYVWMREQSRKEITPRDILSQLKISFFNQLAYINLIKVYEQFLGDPRDLPAHRYPPDGTWVLLILINLFVGFQSKLFYIYNWLCLCLCSLWGQYTPSAWPRSSTCPRSSPQSRWWTWRRTASPFKQTSR